jgi:hypothetical protein
LPDTEGVPGEREARTSEALAMPLGSYARHTPPHPPLAEQHHAEDREEHVRAAT